MCYIQTELLSHYLNTSHVKVQLVKTSRCKPPLCHLNTSHVKVQHKIAKELIRIKINLNTSHVKVQR